MILTEPEAKTKVCPLMSFQTTDRSIARCRASGCMKWRWAPEKSPEEREARAGWMGKDNVGEPKGYCGA